MERSNVDFRLLSLNARGIRSLGKRQAIFNWLKKDKAQICFLQETYSTPEIENTWRKEWRGELFFAHGSTHSKGVLVLINENLEFEVKVISQDPNGRYICIKAEI